MSNDNLYSGKSYIQITNNCANYIEQLMKSNKIEIKQTDLLPSQDLIDSYNPLWGYYNVKSFKVNEKVIASELLFPNHNVYCGDCFKGVCYLKAMYKNT